jgi:hypothetical protein
MVIMLTDCRRIRGVIALKMISREGGEKLHILTGCAVYFFIPQHLVR